MPLSFNDKTSLNRALLERMRLRLTDKPHRLLVWPGQCSDFNHPATQSLMGSIGQSPNPDYSGMQLPNAMGMVLLVKPDNSGTLELSVSGQFDIFHRTIPAVDLMREHLSIENGEPKERQALVTSFRRVTVPFEQAKLTINIPSQINEWMSLQGDNPLSKQMSVVQQYFREDPLTFRELRQRSNGSTESMFQWDDSLIVDQPSLNHAVEQGLFVGDSDILPWSVNIRARLRKAPSTLAGRDGQYLLEIYLENVTSQEISRLYGIATNPHLLDAEFSVGLLIGESMGLPHRLEPADYRFHSNSTVPGYGVTTSVKALGDNTFQTDAMPISKLEKIDNPQPESLGMTQSPDFLALAKDPFPVLEGLVNAIDDYVRSWRNSIDELKRSGNEPGAAVATCELEALLDEQTLMRDGIALLHEHDHLRRCFEWMNITMYRAFQQQNKPIATWRLFQLGFILTQIRAIYERHCPTSELTDHLDTAEVLWFSTGGGKTEAYLGIIAMGMFYDRIKGRLYGPTAWMKFPLRMLSVQQFQRLSYVIAQANIIREENCAELAGHPFTVGYFTGRGTPSSISSNYGDDDGETYLPNLSPKDLKQFRFISDCPYCDAKESVIVEKSIAQCRIKHVCTNSNCWSNTQASAGQYGEGVKGELGIYISDEEVYRYMPTVMVGTIDKLATIALNTRYSYFFGYADHFCPDHGFSMGGRCPHRTLTQASSGEYISERCPNNSRTTKVRTIPLPQMVAPGVNFIIQDELHLLSENTGNFDAHYESLMAALQQGNGGRKPKILSATATIKGYEHHISHLYQRHARRFPAPGIEKGESFYSRVDRNEDGSPMIRRLYAGILPLGFASTMERASALTSTRYLELLDEITEGLRTSPGETAQSLGFSEGHADDLYDHIRTYLNACMIYINNIRGTSNVNRYLEDDQSPNHPEWTCRQLDGKTSLDEIQDAIHLIENKDPDNPMRQLIATSVISHGVDMSRLNFMIVGGWPKSISEYMQSSARAGREQPGIVLSVLSSKSLFQSNVFLNFQDYHRFMDRMVESIPVNRFAPNLLERTLPGIISACLLNWAANQGWGVDIAKKGSKLREALNNTHVGVRSALKNQIMDSMQVPEDMVTLGLFDQRVVTDFRDQLEREVDRVLTQMERMPTNLSEESIAAVIERLMGNRPMRNLRDIESQIAVKAKNNESQELLKALARRD